MKDIIGYNFTIDSNPSDKIYLDRKMALRAAKRAFNKYLKTHTYLAEEFGDFDNEIRKSENTNFCQSIVWIDKYKIIAPKRKTKKRK